MKKVSGKGREIKWFSQKNKAFLCVRTKEESAYAKYLEDRKEVISYEAGKPLSLEHVQQLPRVDLRKEYLKTPWQSDFFLTYEDGNCGIREVVSVDMLLSRADVEKLELSRRYWRSLGITDWKMVILEG